MMDLAALSNHVCGKERYHLHPENESEMNTKWKSQEKLSLSF